jgi:peptide-methionine (S)-S-oxide reductase
MTFDIKTLTGALAAIGMTALMNGPAAAADYAPLPEAKDGQEVAIFAGGCFWCIESDFDKIPGVLATTSGYTGGRTERPSYRQVGSETTGHYEALHVIYDPAQVSYGRLLTAFWHSVDPTDPKGQFCDKGQSYTTAIFPVDAEQRAAAEASKAAIVEAGTLDEPVVTPILDAAPFYPAETYHQNYYQTNPIRYTLYRRNCGRDRTVRKVWGDLAFKGIPK